jgi:hypothetical protein
LDSSPAVQFKSKYVDRRANYNVEVNHFVAMKDRDYERWVARAGREVATMVFKYDLEISKTNHLRINITSRNIMQSKVCLEASTTSDTAAA